MRTSLLQGFATKFLDRTLQPRELITARRLIYGFLVLILFTGSFFWRRYVVEAMATQLAVTEESRGDVELSGEVLRLTLTGSRGLATCYLWNSAIEKQKLNQWNELEIHVGWLAHLQPHFVTPWLFQSWNLAYNVSVESDRVNDKYFYITRGIQFLARGERQNRNNPDMRFNIGFYTQHKICNSDETNVHRSLFQLSCIPPHERDPARFLLRGVYVLTRESLEALESADVPKSVLAQLEALKDKSFPTKDQFLDELGLKLPNQEERERYQERVVNEAKLPRFNWKEFEKFCKEHPRLVRRLREGMRRETKMDQDRQFTCEQASDVVQFLADNWRIPSLYDPIAPTPDSSSWQPELKPQEPKAEVLQRFPVLPPPPHSEDRPLKYPQREFKPTNTLSELDSQSKLADDVDGHAVGRSWYGYAQEPIPDPDDLPGFTKEVEDRRTQRRPRGMTTLLFRGYPALTQSARCDSLQQEGWFEVPTDAEQTKNPLETSWEIVGWFQPRSNLFEDGQPAWIAMPKELSSETAWAVASEMWEKHGADNHLLLNPSDEINKKNQAMDYWIKEKMPFGSQPKMHSTVDPLLPHRERERLLRGEYVRYVNSLAEHDRDLYTSARFLYEYKLYRQLSNFKHHYMRPLVEKEHETVVARHWLHLAETYRLQKTGGRALKAYDDPRALAAWRDKVLSIKDLSKHKEYREDNFIQEQTYDYQLRYLELLREEIGPSLKKEFTRQTALLMQAGHPAQAVNSAAIQHLLSTVWLKEPGTMHMFRGPFDLDVVEELNTPEQVVQVLGVPTAPGSAPLLALTTAGCGQVHPLINPIAVRTMLERRGLVRPKPPAVNPEHDPKKMMEEMKKREGHK
jgi:hypothetical protein